MKKIVIIGPESTGKSTLCAQLATHYSTSWVKEYAREYLLKNGTDYSFDNLLDIAKGQLQLEEQGLANAKDKNQSLVLLDTDMLVMAAKVYSRVNQMLVAVPKALCIPMRKMKSAPIRLRHI